MIPFGYFNRHYDMNEELGRGAYSVVHKCTRIEDNGEFAVKIIDLRPLRLRENFSPLRMRRLVELKLDIILFIHCNSTESKIGKWTL